MRHFIVMGAAALLLAFAGAAAAQQPTQAQASAIRQACRADYQSHCANVPTGGSASLQCLQQNAASLSLPCQQALAAVGGGSMGAPPAAESTAPPGTPPMSQRQEMRLLRASCGSDYRQFCSGVQPGGGRALACLHAYGPQLSPRCRSALLSAQRGC